MEIMIDGEPVPKARPRMTKTGHVYTPKRTKEQEERIRAEWIAKNGNEPLTGCVVLKAVFYMGIPKNISKEKRAMLKVSRPTKRPDIDNLAKLVIDALNGVAYVDDKQIAVLIAGKEYSEGARTVVNVYEA